MIHKYRRERFRSGSDLGRGLPGKSQINLGRFHILPSLRQRVSRLEGAKKIRVGMSFYCTCNCKALSDLQVEVPKSSPHVTSGRVCGVGFHSVTSSRFVEAATFEAVSLFCQLEVPILFLRFTSCLLQSSSRPYTFL